MEASTWGFQTMIRASFCLFSYLSERYSLSRDIAPETRRQYEIAVRLFERWGGGPVLLESLDELRVSAWLRDLSATRAPSTVRAKRVQVLALWRAAADDGLCTPPTKRVRSPKVPWKAPVAFTYDEACRLLRATGRLQRGHPCGIRRSEWWRLAVMVAWDTGLRWGDLVTLQADQIGADGLVVRPQRKTGRPYIGRISASTAEAVHRSLERTPRGTVLPWEASHETFSAQFRRLTSLAGVRTGTWKWLRRGSATDVELERPGSASAHLGHRPGSTVAATNYLDPAILGAARRGPRELF
jgi:integrase